MAHIRCTLLLCICLMFWRFSYAQTPAFSIVSDSTTHSYTIVKSHSLQARTARTASHNFQSSVNANTEKPSTSRDVTVTIPESVDIRLISFITLDVTPVCGGDCGDRAVASAFLSSRAIDLATRTVRYTFDGLEENTSYTLRTIVWGLDGTPCDSDHIYTTSFTTSTSPDAPSKKLLFVINKEWENNQAIDEALLQYIQNSSRTHAGITFEKYYMGATMQDKIALYDYIKKGFIQDNIAYLFFIGQNAAAPVSIILYNTSNQVVNKFTIHSFSFYTQVRTSAYQYSAAWNEFICPKYQDACYRSETEIRNPIFQQNNAGISMGMLLPDPAYDFATRTNAVLSYFTKLNQYHHYAFDFDRNILVSDAFTSEQEVVRLAKQNGRWSGADTLRLGRPKDFFYSGYDQTWRDDFFQKLQTRSYEIFTYNGHGASNYHSFGIYGNDVQNLTSLNTQIINFLSCNVGNFRDYGYLANKYLEKGRVLGVHAFSDLLISLSPNGRSTMAPEFSARGVFDRMANGATLSDAYRLYGSYSPAELILGDPLLTLRKQCDPIIESQASGAWHAPGTWTCGRIPTKNDQVRIKPGHTVTLDGVGEVKQLDVEGELTILEAGQLQY